MTTVLQSVDLSKASGKLLDSTLENIKSWLEAGFLPSWAETAIAELVEDEAWEELNDRFYKQLAFGTGGMRGRTIGKIGAEAEVGESSSQGTPAHPAVGTNCLNDFNVIRATIGLFRYTKGYLQAEGRGYELPRLVIAHDVRHFSRHFCELCASVWTQLGGQAFIFDGPRSTPQLSFTVRHLGATAGIVITASHNPSHDNGYKVYFEDGAQIVSPHAEGIIKEVNTVSLDELPSFFAIDLAKTTVLEASVDASYQEALRSLLLEPEILKKEAPRVVFTPIHGTGRVAAVPLMESVGVDVVSVPEQSVMDPRFPTVASPNPENPEALEMALKKADEVGAGLVLATDPDADRMGVAVRGKSGEMELLNGNQIGSLLAEYRIVQLKARGILPEAGTQSAALIKTFVTTPLQEAIAEAHGLKLINTLTGFKWIGEKLKIYEDELRAALLKEEGIAVDYDGCTAHKRAELLQRYSTFYVFGGEESYGTLAGNCVRDKDANAAAILFCELAAVLKSQGKSFSEYLDELYLKYGYYQEGLFTLLYEGASGSLKIEKILASYRANPPQAIAGMKVESFEDFGRDVIHDADGKQIPPQDFYRIHLEGGYSYAVRGSGTEPKVKFYLFGNEPVAGVAQLDAARASVSSRLSQVKEAIRADAEERAKG